MKTRQVIFEVEERLVRGEKEYALQMRIENRERWCIYSWKKKAPKPEAIDMAIQITMRAMSVYHRQLHIPMFNLVVSK